MAYLLRVVELEMDIGWLMDRQRMSLRLRLVGRRFGIRDVNHHITHGHINEASDHCNGQPYQVGGWSGSKLLYVSSAYTLFEIKPYMNNEYKFLVVLYYQPKLMDSYRVSYHIMICL